MSHFVLAQSIGNRLSLVRTQALLCCPILSTRTAPARSSLDLGIIAPHRFTHSVIKVPPSRKKTRSGIPTTLYSQSPHPSFLANYKTICIYTSRTKQQTRRQVPQQHGYQPEAKTETQKAPAVRYHRLRQDSSSSCTRSDSLIPLCPLPIGYDVRKTYQTGSSKRCSTSAALMAPRIQTSTWSSRGDERGSHEHWHCYYHCYCWGPPEYVGTRRTPDLAS